ncbi:CLIP-associating protein 1 [Xenoophorus captivus]|uniref:CLIP-associating protein 1 n=1 Tax=Xenoophorus captivus TaxID=1517983 RepID=A0ABV0RQI3_9TELE
MVSVGRTSSLPLGHSGVRNLETVNLLGLDLLSALVTRLQDRFRAQLGTVLPSLIDRLGDAKDQVREQDQTLLLKIMDQTASPQYVWDRMLGGFKHKNNRTREGVCLCLIATLNTYGAQGLTLSKIVPHICNLLGDPTSQVNLLIRSHCLL